MLIMFLLKSDLNNWLWALLICVAGFVFSKLYIYLHTRKASDEHASIKSIETAEDKYMTLYIVCFVISLNINDIITIPINDLSEKSRIKIKKTSFKEVFLSKDYTTFVNAS